MTEKKAARASPKKKEHVSQVKKMLSGMSGTVRDIGAKKMLFIILYVVLWYLADKVIHFFVITTGSATERLLFVLGNFGVLFAKYPFPSVNPKAFLGAAFIVMMVACGIEYWKMDRKTFRTGEEYGSARWGTAEDIKPFVDKDKENNIILSATERLTMNPRAEPWYNARNKNIVLIGGSGSGKTRFFYKPNILQCMSKDYPCSMVVTDPKGTLLPECGTVLQKVGYRIRVLNLIDFARSMRFNPFSYIRNEEDILTLVDVLIENTKGEGEKSGEDFWVKSERLLYMALIGYIWQESPEEECNIDSLVGLIAESETREENDDYTNTVDVLFEDLAEDDPDCFAVRQYHKYKLAAGKTAKSILISCAARLAPFDIPQVRDLLMTDELELDLLGTEKTALFVILSDNSPTFRFIGCIMFAQLFRILCDIADNTPEYNGRLPLHVRCFFDELANIGKIPHLDELIATVRSRNISMCLGLQSKAQLSKFYKDHEDIIVDNCDTKLFFGGQGDKTLKELSESLDKSTIDLVSSSDSRGSNRTWGANYQKVGRELMTKGEIALMNGQKCIVQIRGVPPFFSDKYDVTKHPRYKWLMDNDKKNKFDAAAYIKAFREEQGKIVRDTSDVPPRGTNDNINNLKKHRPTPILLKF